MQIAELEWKPDVGSPPASDSGNNKQLTPLLMLSHHPILKVLGNHPQVCVLSLEWCVTLIDLYRLTAHTSSCCDCC